jgi:S-adenosylmethionine decarboxylase proenzyme
MQGLHLTADLFGCRDPDRLMRNAPALRQACEAFARQAGLQVLGGRFHQFDAAEQPGGGVTGMVLLAESHLAVHTWPEQAAATLDVYVCNFRGDNSGKARQVCDALIAQLQPARCERLDIWRGREPAESSPAT